MSQREEVQKKLAVVRWVFAPLLVVQEKPEVVRWVSGPPEEVQEKPVGAAMLVLGKRQTWTSRMDLLV